MRWITLLGRTGTVLIMVGLALVLVSLIPPAAPGFYSGHGGVIAPEKYRADHSRVHTPQTGFQISVESTDSIHVYILGVSPGEFNNWRAQVTEAYPDLPFMIDRYIMPLVFFREAYPDLEDPEFPDIMDIMWDIAVLEKGLQTYPETILWQSSADTTLSHEFFPPDVLHVTVMVANPSSDAVEVETETKDLTALAPKEGVVAAARLLIPIGVVLAIPWLVSKKVKKRTL